MSGVELALWAARRVIDVVASAIDGSQSREEVERRLRDILANPPRAARVDPAAMRRAYESRAMRTAREWIDSAETRTHDDWRAVVEEIIATEDAR